MVRFLSLLLLLPSLSASAEPLTLRAEDWARPRSGAALVQQPVLSELLRVFTQEPDGVIVVGHATGEAGQLWAEELRSWLVALGVSSERVVLDARPELHDVLALTVDKRENR